MGQKAATMANAAERLTMAPFAMDEWSAALRCLAEATNSSFAQIAGWVGPDQLQINLAWNEPERMIEHWIDIGGANPSVNPIIRVGLNTPELKTVLESDIISARERKRLTLWGEFHDRYDLPHVCFTPIWRDGRAHLMLVVCRSARTGEFDAHERKTFSALAPFYRQAAIMSEAINAEANLVLKGAFDDLSLSALALDAFGRVVALSRGDDGFLRKVNVLKLKHRRLACAAPGAEPALAGAVAPYLVVDGPPSAPVSFVVKGSRGAWARLRITPLPRSRFDIGFGAIAMIVVEQTGERPSTPASLGVLTPAEKEVASALLEGLRPKEIALKRDASIHTVRAQIKSICAKTGVSGQVEFFATQASSGDGRLRAPAGE